MGHFAPDGSAPQIRAGGVAMFDQLSRDELLQVIDLSHRCLAAESYDDLREIITAVESLTSYERAALCAVSAEPEGALAHYVNHSFGDEWVHLYTAQGFGRVDPVLRHARSVSGPFRWRDVFTGSVDPVASSAFTEAARDFGLVEGVAYACRSRASSDRTLLSLASAEDRPTEHAIALLSSVGPHLHEAYDRLRHRERPAAGRASGIELTPREKEILAWTQDGKTYWEIGQIIGISQRTVKYHFARIKEKLDVVSASHAVAKAMRIGLLE
jgi:LuxR family quorum sensing-dependent transcriptional regulator